MSKCTRVRRPSMSAAEVEAKRALMRALLMDRLAGADAAARAAFVSSVLDGVLDMVQVDEDALVRAFKAAPAPTTRAQAGGPYAEEGQQTGPPPPVLPIEVHLDQEFRRETAHQGSYASKWGGQVTVTYERVTIVVPEGQLPAYEDPRNARAVMDCITIAMENVAKKLAPLSMVTWAVKFLGDPDERPSQAVVDAVRGAVQEAVQRAKCDRGVCRTAARMISVESAVANDVDRNPASRFEASCLGGVRVVVEEATVVPLRGVAFEAPLALFRDRALLEKRYAEWLAVRGLRRSAAPPLDQDETDFIDAWTRDLQSGRLLEQGALAVPSAAEGAFVPKVGGRNGVNQECRFVSSRADPGAASALGVMTLYDMREATRSLWAGNKAKVLGTLRVTGGPDGALLLGPERVRAPEALEMVVRSASVHIDRPGEYVRRLSATFDAFDDESYDTLLDAYIGRWAPNQNELRDLKELVQGVPLIEPVPGAADEYRFVLHGRRLADYVGTAVRGHKWQYAGAHPGRTVYFEPGDRAAGPVHALLPEREPLYTKEMRVKVRLSAHATLWLELTDASVLSAPTRALPPAAARSRPTLCWSHLDERQQESSEDGLVWVVDFSPWYQLQLQNNRTIARCGADVAPISSAEAAGHYFHLPNGWSQPERLITPAAQREHALLAGSAAAAARPAARRERPPRPAPEPEYRSWGW